MSFAERWRRDISASIARAVSLAQSGESIDFTYGLLATAVLWPVRAAVQDFEPEAIAAVQRASQDEEGEDGASGKVILRAMQAWGQDRLVAGRELASAAAADAQLRSALRNVLRHFDATALLQEQLAGQFGDVSGQVIEQIRASIVNVGGVMTIDTLVLSSAVQPEIPPPAAPDAPPSTPNFVGREAELASYGTMLQEHHIAVITGMAGVGKTALAAVLARRASDSRLIFWHSFHEGQRIESLIWELANFLAWHGHDQLWRLLQRARQTGGSRPPAKTLFNYIIQTMRGQKFLLCFDDLQYVDDDPQLLQLVSRLRELILAGELQVIMTSRRRPAFLQVLRFETLEGFDLDDTRRFLHERGAEVDEASVISLHEATAGNATFLTLAANALAAGAHVERLLAHLADTPDVAHYLMEQVDEKLSVEEQTVMAALSILLQYAGSSEVVAAICDGASVWRPLQRLAQRHLLIVYEGADDPRYNLHALVQAFYYKTLGRRERENMHRRAAVYYRDDGRDPLRATLHFMRAGDYSEVTGLLGAEFWHFVNHGQMNELVDLLAQLDGEHLEPHGWARVQLTLGRAQTILGRASQARAALEQALAQTEELVADDSVPLRVELCLSWAELLDQTAPEEALQWLQRGLELTTPEEDELRAPLLVKRGQICMNQGNYAQALAALQEGLARMPASAADLRCEALLHLSGVHFWQGDIDEAREATLRGLAISRQLHDHFRTIDLLSNFALCEFTVGRWPEAIAAWKDALRLARELGSREQELSIAGNLGVAYVHTGRFDDARRQHEAALALAQQLDDKFSFQLLHFYSAELSLRQGDLAQARAALAEAEALARSLDSHGSLLEIETVRAEILLMEGKPAQARDRAMEALEQSVAQEMSLEEGRLLRTLARALASLGKTEEALRHFAASYECLSNVDPYEGARTLAHWALSLQETDASRAAQQLREAEAVFRRLGAQWDLDWLGVVHDEDPEYQAL